MPKNIFFKLFEIYDKDKVNLLDCYANYIHLTWYKFEYNNIEIWDVERTSEMEKSLLLLKKYKIVNSIDLDIQGLKLIKIINIYTEYLIKKSNEPRKKACTFTSKKDVKSYIFDKYGKKCLCCGSDKNISLDHIIPITKGGDNSVDNLQPLCKSCNSKKSTRIIDYRKKHKGL